MPVATRRSQMNNPLKSTAVGSSSKLRPVTPTELEEWSHNYEYNIASTQSDPTDLDDPYEYPFKDQEQVWVRTKEDNWCFGRVTGRLIRVGQTRQGTLGLYYPVNFGLKHHLRKYFAPLNGEIKPDTDEVRQLLRDSGWIDDVQYMTKL